MDFANGPGKGGQTFRGPFGKSVSRNITSHREKGIGAWSDAEIKRAIAQGIRKDGSHLKPPMGFEWYARMTDADLSAIAAHRASKGMMVPSKSASEALRLWEEAEPDFIARVERGEVRSRRSYAAFRGALGGGRQDDDGG